MGVILGTNGQGHTKLSFPHTRGGDPIVGDTPQKDRNVFPTHVGVIRLSNKDYMYCMCFPHTRGGDPIDSTL